MQTNTENCYWALLSRKDFSFLYLSPWLSNNLKNESSDLLLGTSIFDYFRPDEKMLAQKDLTRVNNNKLSLSITRCHFSTISKIKRKLNLKFSSLSPTTSTFNNNNNNNNNTINFNHGYPYSSSSTSSSSSSSPQIRPISTTALDLSPSTNVDEYIVMDIGISLVSHDIILACFHSDDGRVHNGDKCSCGESFEFTQKTIDELNKCLNNKNSSSPNGSAIKFTTPPSTPHSEKFFPGNNPLFPPPPPSDRIFQIFDRKSKDLILTWPNPTISFTDNSNNNSYYNKNDFSKLILDCVNNDNKINNYNNYNTPNCLKATVHDKRLLLLSSSGSYGHVESLIIPYGNIIFASFQILSNTINPSSKLSLTNNNNIGNGNFSESTPCSPTSTLKLTTPICMTAVTGDGGDDYRSGDKRPRSLSPLLSISSLQQPQHHHTLYSKRHKMSSPNNNNNKLTLFPSQPRPLVVDDSAYNTSNPISSPNHHHHNNNNDNNGQHLFPQQHYNNNNNNDNEKPSMPLLQQPCFINHYNYNVYHHNNYQNHNNLHVHNNNNHNNLHINHEVHNGNGNGNNTYPSPKSHNNNLPFISHNPSSSISSPQSSHSFAQNNNHHINHQYQQPPTTAATTTTTTIPKSQKPNSSSLRSPASSQRKNNNGLKECESCHTNTSPEWRRGPTGHKTLCNACGLRYSRTIARENRKKEQAQSEEEMRKREQRERDDMARERVQRMMDHHPLMNNSHAFYYK